MIVADRTVLNSVVMPPTSLDLRTGLARHWSPEEGVARMPGTTR
jgi:hypothetical protein